MKPNQSTSCFTDKVAIVTGATFVVGRATTRAFAREGTRAVVEIKDTGGIALFVPTDVTRESDRVAWVERTLARASFVTGHDLLVDRGLTAR